MGAALEFAFVGISIDMESQYKAKGSEEWGEIRLLVQAVLTASHY